MGQKIEYHLKNKKLYYYGSNQMKKEEKCKIEKLKIKKFLYCILVCMVVCITLQGTIYANEDENSEAQTFKIEFNVENADNSNYKVYVLLSKEYIEEAIRKANLDIKYTGSSTLLENDIAGINVNKDNIIEDLYEDNNKEYVQIVLDKAEENKYEFNIITQYTDDDVLFGVENKEEAYNYIVSLEDFVMEDGIYKVYYDYQEKIAENYPKEEGIQLWQILLIVLIVVIVLIIICKMNKKQ